MNGACAARDGAVPADLFQYWQFTWSNIKLKYSKLHFKVINHIIMCEGLTFQPMSLISLISLVEDINWSSSHAHMFLLEVKMYSSGFGLMIPVWSNTFSEIWMNGWQKECLYDVSEKNAKIRRQQLSWLSNVWVSVCFLLFWLLFYSILIKKKINWVMYKMRSVYDWKNAFAKIAWEGRRLCGNMWKFV